MRRRRAKPRWLRAASSGESRATGRRRHLARPAGRVGTRSAQKLAGARRWCRRAPLWISRPVSRVLCGDGRGPPRDGHSSRTPVARRLKQPTRTAGSGHGSRDFGSRAVPIRSCSRWGLPCRFRCRSRGALLPHRFTLAGAHAYTPRRSVFCGTFPRVTPAGRYPAPCVHGARTFLPGSLSADTGTAVRPTDRATNGVPLVCSQVPEKQ
jgi:hypothetical protein